MLNASELYLVVTGAEVPATNATEASVLAWQEKDVKAQRLIVASVDKKVLLYIMNCNTVMDMYK